MRNIQFNDDELQAISTLSALPPTRMQEAVKMMRSLRDEEARYQLKIGDRVSFTARRVEWEGVIVKKGPKNLVVQATSKPLFGNPQTMEWRVAPTLLTKID